MPIATVGYTEAKSNWADITRKVMEERIEVTVLKNNKPAFMIVPIDREGERSLVDISEEVTGEYSDILQRLA